MKFLLVIFMLLNLKAYANENYQNEDINLNFDSSKKCFYIPNQHIVENEKIISLITKKNNVEVSNYDAGNAFGAQTIVNKMSGEKIYYAITVPSILSELQTDDCLYFLGNNHEDKDKFKVSIEYELTNEGELKKSYYKEPTFRSPYERDITEIFKLKKFISITFLKNGSEYFKLKGDESFNSVLSKVLEKDFKIENVSNYDVILNCDGGWNNPSIIEDAILFKKGKEIEVMYTSTDYEKSRVYKNVVLDLNQGFNFFGSNIMYYIKNDLVVLDMNKLIFNINESNESYTSNDYKLSNLNPPFTTATHSKSKSLNEIYDKFYEFDLNRESLELNIKADRKNSYDVQSHTYDCEIIELKDLPNVLIKITEKDSNKYLKKFNKYLKKKEERRKKLKNKI